MSFVRVECPELPRSLAALDQMSTSMQAAVAEAMTDVAEDIMDESKDQFVPFKDGELERSGMVYPPAWTGGVIEVALGYGENASKAYAWHWHEYPDCGCPDLPPQINWTRPGSGPKYLEKPFFLHQENLTAEINAAVEIALMRAAGA